MVGPCPRCGTDPGFEWAICPGCGMRADGPNASPEGDRWASTIVERSALPGAERARFAQGAGDFYQPVTPGEARLPLRFGTEADDKTVVQGAYDRAFDDHDDHTIIERRNHSGDTPANDATVIVRGGRKGVSGPLAYVIQRNGIRAGRVLLVSDGTTIGRASDQHIILSDDTVSKHHAKIRCEGSDFIFWDLASSNGSFIVQPDGSQKRIMAPLVLNDGDTIVLGDVRITFVEVDTEHEV